MDWTSSSSTMFSILFVLSSVLLYVPGPSAQSHVCDFTRSLQALSFTASYLTSPNYPLFYSPSTTCEWIITASVGYVIELTFVKFETDGYFLSDSCSMYSDFLEIYDGRYRTSSKLLGKYCSDKLPANVYSSGTSLYLRFVSDRYTVKMGFKIRYKAVKPKPNSAICSPFNSFFQNNNIQVHGSSGYIESPLYGSKYPSNMQCTWVVTVPEGKKIVLKYVSYFSVGRVAYYCSSYPITNHDYIQIRNGRYSFSKILRTDCGQNKPASSVYSSGRYMWIRFKSNNNNNNPTNTTGFKIKYEAISSKKHDEKGSKSSDSSEIGTVIGIVVGVSILIFLVCICVCLAQRKRTPGHVTVQAPGAPQTMTVQGSQNQPIQYSQQAPSGYVPPTPIGYMPTPQSSYPPQSSGYPMSSQGSYQYPPLGNNPFKTTSGSGTSIPGYPPQSSVPMMPYSQQPISDDPPPPYPGLPTEYLPQAAPGQPAPSNPIPPYPPVQSAETHSSSAYPPQAATGQPIPSNPNPPYPIPQGVEMQQSSPLYPTPLGTMQATAPPPF